MADWPVWVWVVIAVIALIIIGAIIFGTRRKDDIDEGGPFAAERPVDDPLTPRRGVPTDTVAEPEAAAAEPVAAGRRMDDTVAYEDEETLTGPLAVPDDAGTHTTPDEAAAPRTPSDELRMASEPEEDFAADAPAETTRAADEWRGDTAGDVPPQRPEDQYAPDEPVVAAPEGMASQDPDSHFETPASDDGTEVAPEEVADEGRAVEAVPETAPAPATEDTDKQHDPDLVGNTDDDEPPAKDFVPPRHADGADYGDPVRDVEADDDVPRDDLGRRLDPYGNPVD